MHIVIQASNYDGPDPSGGRHLDLRWFAVCRRGRGRGRQRSELVGAFKKTLLHVMSSYIACI